MALKPHLPFLADVTWVGYPWEVKNAADFLRVVKSSGVRYVELGDLELDHVPGLEPIARPDSLPWLVRIYRAPEISIFEVK